MAFAVLERGLSMRKLAILAILLVAPAAGIGQQPIVSPGTISRVTVYRGQALVTRQIEAELPAGVADLVIPDLPARVLPESIYAQADDQKVKVLSVRYRQQAVEQETRQEVRQLDEQIEQLRRQIKHLTANREHLQTQWRLFEGLKDFTIAAEKSDLGRGVLTFEPIKGLVGLIEQKGKEYLEQRLQMDDTMEDLNKKLDLLQRQRTELVADQSRTERQALVTINSPGGKVRLDLNYLVAGASWQPQYNLRAEPRTSTVDIEYIAVVNQTSGEDWKGVSLSLSTAEPSMVATPPELKPLLVGLTPGGQVAAQSVSSSIQAPWPAAAVAQQARQIAVRKSEVAGKGMAATDELNRLALENQLLDLNLSGGVAQQFQKELEQVARREGVSVTYDLPGRLNLPSRSDQQIVSIALISAKADFVLIACPLLTDYVYLQADILNASQTILLPGPAAIFRSGQFVGRGDLPLVTIGEQFTAGFGIDSQVQVTRELQDKVTRTQGGNRIDTFTYRLAVNNYKDISVGLRVLDRLPYTEDQAVRIELGRSDPPLSTDEQYVLTQRKKGILRWDLQLAPKTTGTKATVITYSYVMEYDRNMRIEPRSQEQTR